jgi:uncharacterized protein YqjF (DUF2071 family)
MFMRWHDLLFIHWPVDAHLLRPLMPKSLELETFDGMGVTLPTDVPPLLHYAKLLEVAAWLPQRVREETSL